MGNLPETIKHPDAFAKSPAAGFDGIFDWSWTDGCFGDGKITPMDFDGVVERKGNFIIFETKNPDTPIPGGQMITLQKAHSLRCFSIMFIYGKTAPESGEFWFPSSKRIVGFSGVKDAKDLVARWYEYANNNPFKPIDATFLDRRINTLSEENRDLKRKIMEAQKLLEQALYIFSEDAV